MWPKNGSQFSTPSGLLYVVFATILCVLVAHNESRKTRGEGVEKEGSLITETQHTHLQKTSARARRTDFTQ